MVCFTHTHTELCEEFKQNTKQLNKIIILSVNKKKKFQSENKYIFRKYFIRFIKISDYSSSFKDENTFDYHK